MGAVVLLARLLLSAVFAVAGIAKLLDIRGSRKSLIDFGVPALLAVPLGIFFPLAELACAAALVVKYTATWGAMGAAALLALFVAGIGISLARGRKPDCHCFGQLHSEPVSGKTIARNVVLLSLALLVASKAGEGPEALPDLRGMTSAEAGLLSAVALLGLVLALTLWFLIHMLRQNGRLLLRLEAVEKKLGIDPNATAVQGLPVGEPAPPLRLAALDGRTVTSGTLFEAGKPTLLVFTEPDCGACEALLPEIARWQREHADRLLIVPVSGGGLEANAAKSAEHEIQNTLLQAGRETSEAYKVTASPSAVLVKDGKIASPLSQGGEEIRNLVRRSTLPPPVKKGDIVPALQLSDMDGRTVDLASLRGRRRLILFWNPSCGFCKGMLDDVKKWERRPPRNAPELVIVSSGTVEANREQGFRSPVLLDPIFGAGNVLGANGTPSGVIIDEDGRVASEVGVGAPAVLALAGVEPSQPQPQQ